MANSKPRGGLMSKVYAKIEKEFGLAKSFTHWDFEEFLGEDKAKERNRISARFAFLHKHCAFERVGEISTHRKCSTHGVYKAVRFPIGTANQADNQGAYGKLDGVGLDTLFFNLGRKKSETKIDLQLVGRTVSQYCSADQRRKAPKATNTHVHRIGSN